MNELWAVYDYRGYLQIVITLSTEDRVKAQGLYQTRKRKKRAYLFLPITTIIQIETACPHGVGEIVKI